MSGCVRGHARPENTILNINFVWTLVLVPNVCAHVWRHESLRFCVEKRGAETMNLRIFVNLKERLAHRSAPLCVCVCALTTNALLEVCRYTLGVEQNGAHRCPCQSPSPQCNRSPCAHTHSGQSTYIGQQSTWRLNYMQSYGRTVREFYWNTSLINSLCALL